MKYAQGIIGLLVGTALGGSVIAATTETGGTASKDSIRATVLEVIKEEPQAIIESLNAWQAKQQADKLAGASAALKKDGVKDSIFNDATLPFAGNKDGKHVVAEFFDYNCPVCKMQFQVFTEMLAKDKELKIVFHEYPIFGATSEENSRLGLAVADLYPEKYWQFHEKMMGGKGHEQNNDRTLAILKELGLDVAKVQEKSKTEEVAAQLEKSRRIGQSLNIQGTPTLIVEDTIIPHAAQAPELEILFK